MINQEQKDLLNQYAEIKKDIKLLEEKADILNPQVLDIMQEQGAEEIEIRDVGKLSLGSRRTWKYSAIVKEIDDKLKEQKKDEERRGVADYQEKHYVIFKTNKDE